MGLVEAKCPRCGNISSLHSFDLLLRGRKHSYILVYNPKGRIVAATKSASDILG
jgi:phage FluMu protein Com